MAQAQPPFSPPAPLGWDEPLHDFELAGPASAPFASQSARDRILVVDFWSAECPVSRKYDAYFSGFAQSYGAKGVVFVAVDSNWYEDEAQLHQAISERALPFPVLRDSGARLADYLGAETTPHLFIFDGTGRLRYRGAVDDTTFANKQRTVNYLEQSVDALLLGTEVPVRETTPYGCTIIRAWD